MVAASPFHRLPKFLTLLGSPSGRRASGVLGAVAIVLLLAFAMAPPGGTGSMQGTPPSAHPTTTGGPPTSWAIHQGHAEAIRAGPHVSGGSTTPGTVVMVCNTVTINTPLCWNFTLVSTPNCAPPPSNATLADLGLNLTVATSPASGVSAAPMNFTWNITVNGAGLPPYYVQLVVFNANLTYLTTNLTGSIPLTDPGLYEVDVLAEDSSCSQTAYAAFSVNAYYPGLGPNPVHVQANVTSGTVPANVTYSVNVTGVPSNYTVIWTTPGFFGQTNTSGIAHQTYFLPGVYSATACLVGKDPNGTTNGVFLGCGTSSNVTIGGASPVVTTVSIAPGPFPTNVTFTVTEVNTSYLPNDTMLFLIVWNASHIGTWNQTNNTSVSLTVPAGCGTPWTTYVPPNGICPVVADFSLNDPSRHVNAGDLGFGVLVANLTANGTPSLWNPSLSYSYGPLNGSLPFNLTVNITATNGLAPYTYGTVVYGRASGAANATLYPTLNATVSGWNGSTQSLNFTFTRAGVYFLSVFVYDSDDAWIGFSLPLIILGNVSALRPMHVSASAGAGSSASGIVANTSTQFLASTTGGLGPFLVQWDFGDGSYASSLSGVPIFHAYTAPGIYTPSVTIQDGRGQTIVTKLSPITVRAAHFSPPSTNRSTGNPSTSYSVALGPVLAAAVLGVVLLAAGTWAARVEVRRQGEALAAGVEREIGEDRSPGPTQTH